MKSDRLIPQNAPIPAEASASIPQLPTEPKVVSLSKQLRRFLPVLDNIEAALVKDESHDLAKEVLTFKTLISRTLNTKRVFITNQVVMDLSTLFYKLEMAEKHGLCRLGIAGLYSVATASKAPRWLVILLELSLARNAFHEKRLPDSAALFARVGDQIHKHLPGKHFEYYAKMLRRSIEIASNPSTTQIMNALLIYYDIFNQREHALHFVLSYIVWLDKSNLLDEVAIIYPRLVKMYSDDPSDPKVQAVFIRLADAYFLAGSFRSAQKLYQRVFNSINQKKNVFTMALWLKIKFCVVKLNPEEIVSQQKIMPELLGQDKAALKLAEFKEQNEAFKKAYNVIPEELIPLCTPQELLQTNQTYYTYYGESVTSTAYTTLAMEGGNGGFDPYPGLSKVAVNHDRMVNYQYSEPSQSIVNTMASYLKHKRIVRPDVPIGFRNILAGNGTTQLYHIFLSKIFGDRPRTAGKDILLVPSPSYGLFAPQVYASGGEIKTIPLLKSNNYKLTADQLNAAILETNATLFEKSRIALTSHYKMFLQAATDAGLNTQQLPAFVGENAPTREAAEANLHDIKQSTLKLVDETPILRARIAAFGWFSLPLPPEIPKVVALFFCNIHNPTGKAYNQQEVDSIDKVRRQHHVTVIEDLTHHELKFNPQLQLGYFANREGVLPYQQVTLVGISKNLCAAAWRVGVAFISSDFERAAENVVYDNKSRFSYMGVAERMFSQSVFLTPFQRKAVELGFDIRDEEKRAYIYNNNNLYLLRCNLFRALVEGIYSFADPKQALDVIDYVEKTSPSSLAFLNDGIPLLSILTVPQGSFFILVDFSKLSNKYVGHLKLDSSIAVYQALRGIVNIDAIPAEGMLCGDMNIMRFTLAVSRQKIFECVNRLAVFVSYVTDEPALDLSAIPAAAASSPASSASSSVKAHPTISHAQKCIAAYVSRHSFWSSSSPTTETEEASEPNYNVARTDFENRRSLPRK
ncbi:MAG: aminotransferase class I/II-fold pyridoxal phosphate-dependent enzyme [Gammaproteobacteria bacterium]|nr:aminotransferase class I/II-fold pyridoxal phosphate-dependent enzyme [Gammaproteobacteria bacterium]